VEVREGKRSHLFVLGDTKRRYYKYVTQLIINPFRGYSEANGTS